MQSDILMIILIHHIMTAKKQ